MKGDLHTLKKVCMYASKVMLAGTFILLAICIALVILGTASLFSGAAEDLLSTVLGFTVASASSTKVAASLIEFVCIFAVATETVRRIYIVTVSIQNEHSPFTERNTDVVRILSFVYLAAAPVLAVLELLADRLLASSLFMFFGCVLIAVVLFIFALIVRYGTVLQNESDHTL